jgi:hypothetical protein
VIDHGKVFVSETFMTACRVPGISVQPARPYTPTGKGICERTFRSINTLFCQYVAGYTGSDVTRRGKDVASQAAWTLPQLQELPDEWIVCWQSRPHDGLRSPYLPGRELSPDEAHAVMVARAGYLPVPLSGEDYIELLPVTWRAVNDYGIQIGYRTYDCAGLGPYRRRSSAAAARNGRWEVHSGPYDLSRAWMRDPDREGWITVPWTRLPMVSAPFADFTWRHARDILTARGQDDTGQTAIARVPGSLLARAGNGPSSRVAARTAAAAAVTRLPGLPGAGPETSRDEGEPEDSPAEPSGVFDPLGDESGLW